MVNSKKDMKEYTITLSLKKSLLVVLEDGIQKGGSENLVGGENDLSGKKL